MKSSSDDASALTLFGLNRTGKIVYGALFVLVVPAFLAWTIWLPRVRFSDGDEQLFRAARHGDRAAIEQALNAGARIEAASPVDGKTALFRAAVLGHTDAVRLLLEHGADPAARGLDGRSPVEVVEEARSDEHDPEAARGLDAVLNVLRNAESGR